MANKLKVLVPRTKDGKNLVYDENKQPIFDSHILELTAKSALESISAKLPEHLRYKFEIINDVEKPVEVATLVNEQVAAKDAEIEKLKAELEAAKAQAAEAKKKHDVNEPEQVNEPEKDDEAPAIKKSTRAAKTQEQA
jgi:cell division protein FtsB